MKSVFATLATFAALTCGALAQGPLTINTPTSPVVCQPLLLTWSGGTSPYFLSILPGNEPGATALFSFPSTTSTSVTWIVNFSVGTSLGLTLRDSTGATAQSAPFTVQPGSDTGCLNSTGSSTSAGSATGSAPPTPSKSTSLPIPSVTTPTTTTPPVTPVTSPSPTVRPSSTTTSAAVTPSKSTNAASARAVHIGAAGMIGAAVIALVA